MKTRYLSPGGEYVNESSRQLANCPITPLSLLPVMDIVGRVMFFHEVSVKPFCVLPCGDNSISARRRGSLKLCAGEPFGMSSRAPPIICVVNAPYEWPPTPMRF